MDYYIQGDAANADKIKAAFEKLGVASNANGYNYKNDYVLYFSAGGMIHMIDTNSSWANIIKTHPDYKELELPKPHYDISNFHAGMPVLVRDNNEEEWRHTAFSHMTSRFYENKFAAGCTYWRQCIPFNDYTKHLLGTTDMCDEQYINW